MGYRGISAHRKVPRVTDYETAVAAQRSGSMRSRIAGIRELSDGDIAFRLHQTDVVVWSPDNSVRIDNYGSVTTSGFARHFLPRGIHLNYPVLRRGVSGGASTIQFRRAAGDAGYVLAICQGDVVRFCQTADDLWEPDESTCYAIRLPMSVNSVAARRMIREYHLTEFTNWLSVAPHHLEVLDDTIIHEEWNLEECMTALRDRNWRRVAEHVPLVEADGRFGRQVDELPIFTEPHHLAVTLGSVERLKLAMWAHLGIINFAERTIWDCAEYARSMSRVRKLGSLGIDVGDLGPET